MGRARYRFDTAVLLLNAALAAAMIVFAVLTAARGVSLRYFPVMAGIAAAFYFLSAVHAFAHAERRHVLKALLLLSAALFCGAFAYVAALSL